MYYPNYYQPQSQLDYLRGQQQGIQWIQGEEAAKAYLMAPGNSVLLMDSEQSTFYIKSTDRMGMPSLRVFDYTERETAPKAPILAANNLNEEYVTRKEFEALNAKLEEIMKGANNNGKSDILSNEPNGGNDEAV